ncbi:hypothetical protein BH10BAC2_BH10BAC2_17840 [soil metagenome]
MKNLKKLFSAFPIMIMLICTTYYSTAQTGWLIKGNSNINPSINFIGTTNAQPLRFRINNFPAGELNPVNGNTALGINTLLSNTTGTGNVAIGTNALYKNTRGRNLVAIGDSALFNFNGLLAFSNTAIGSKALFSATGTYRSTATGFQSLYSSLSGYDNTANGVQALYANTSGNSNTGIGSNSLYANTTGIRNTAVGTLSLEGNTTGIHNTAIGYNADVSSNNLSNATAIGANATVSASNSLVLGNNANVGIGTTAPNTKLQVHGGYIRITEAEAGANLRLGGLDGYTGIWSDAGPLNIGAAAGKPLILQDGGSATGNVGIGTINPTYKLSVKGTIQAQEIRVETGWADYVFEEDYKLRSLDNVAAYIKQNKHLPGILSAKEIQENGLAVGEVQTKMMEKIEELTLYLIEQNTLILKLQEKIEQVEKQKGK